MFVLDVVGCCWMLLDVVVGCLCEILFDCFEERRKKKVDGASCITIHNSQNSQPTFNFGIFPCACLLMAL
jgi:hypothetical protein